MSNRPSCAGQDPKYWFPVGEPDSEGFETYDYESEEAEEGYAICITCPVIDLCAERNWNLPHGIIAGKNPQFRGFSPEGVRVKKIPSSKWRE